MMDARAPSQSRLQRTGVSILAAGGSRPSSSGALSAGRETPANSVHSGDGPAPPSVTRKGRLYSEKRRPSLTPFAGTAENLPSLRDVQMQRHGGRPEAASKCLWSDSVAHLE